MTAINFLKTHRGKVLLILLLALTFRLFLVLEFPHVAGDSKIYEDFAINLNRYHVYSHYAPEDGAPPAPTLIRVPGYPIFLSIIFLIFGQGNETAVRVTQAILDTFTCLIISLIVFELGLGELKHRQRLQAVALLLAAICPFIANYSATILTEVPTTFLLTASLLFAVKALKISSVKWWLLTGIFVGLATMFRPESGLVLAAIIPAILTKYRVNKRLVRAFIPVFVLLFGLALPLTPWTARNLITLKTFQPLAPFDANDPDEFVPHGYLNWARTWVWNYSHVADFIWPMETYPIRYESLPKEAYGDEGQKALVYSMLETHNGNLEIGLELDASFSALAKQRIKNNPLQYFLVLPVLRSFSMWFTPRTELIPLEDNWGFMATLILFVVNIVLFVLAGFGICKLRKNSEAIVLPVGIFLIRTLFFAYFSFPEPRYLLEAYPILIILAVFAFERTQPS